MREFWDLCVSRRVYASFVGLMRIYQSLCANFNVYAFLEMFGDGCGRCYIIERW
mgnify:CR=1 FL=1